MHCSLRSGRCRKSLPLRVNSIIVVDAEFQSADGLVIVRVNIDDADRREQLIHRIVNLPSSEITETLFEIHTADWDEGLWDDELAYFSELLFGDDILTIWQFNNGEYSRYSLSAHG